MTECWFVELLQTAVRHYRQESFGDFVAVHRNIGDVCISDDGSFERLCETNGYVLLIQQLLDCWIDSNLNSDAYPDMSSTDWYDLATSLLNDIRFRQVPSNVNWNLIYTLPCLDCGVMTKISKSGFVCPECNQTIAFPMPTDSVA